MNLSEALSDAADAIWISRTRHGSMTVETMSFVRGRHHVLYIPGAHGPFRDGISINGTWFEDQIHTDTFCAELFADLTGMSIPEIRETAQVYQE